MPETPLSQAEQKLITLESCLDLIPELYSEIETLKERVRELEGIGREMLSTIQSHIDRV